MAPLIFSLIAGGIASHRADGAMPCRVIACVLAPQAPPLELRLQGSETLGGIEVAGFLPKYYVGQKSRTGGHMLAQAFIFVRVQAKPAERTDRQQYQQQSGKDALDAAGIEIAEAERASVDAA